MSKLRAAAEKVAHDMLDEGIPGGQIGLLMSKKTHERLFGFDRNAPDDVLPNIAAGAVFLPALGMVAAGPLLDELSGLPPIDLASALKIALGVDEEEAHALADDVSDGGVVVVGGLGPVEAAPPANETVAEPAVAETIHEAIARSGPHAEGSVPSVAEAKLEGKPEAEKQVQAEAKPEAEAKAESLPADPQVRRFSLLELD